MLLFSFQLLVEKVLKNRFFLAFGKLLVLNVFSIRILIQKVLKIVFLNLLPRSWFWMLLFSNQILIQKVLKKLIFLAFGKILVLDVAFFLSTSN